MVQDAPRESSAVAYAAIALGVVMILSSFWIRPWMKGFLAEHTDSYGMVVALVDANLEQQDPKTYTGALGPIIRFRTAQGELREHHAFYYRSKPPGFEIGDLVKIEANRKSHDGYYIKTFAEPEFTMLVLVGLGIAAIAIGIQKLVAPDMVPPTGDWAGSSSVWTGYDPDADTDPGL